MLSVEAAWFMETVQGMLVRSCRMLATIAAEDRRYFDAWTDACNALENVSSAVRRLQTMPPRSKAG